MEWVYDDGGRKAAGYMGRARDCAARAIAIVTGCSYQQAIADLAATCEREREREEASTRLRGGVSTPHRGIHTATMRAHMERLGWEWVPTMKVGQGCKVHLRADELPGGTIICRVSRHFVAVVDGVARDNHDPRREGRRCVYGYWRQRPAISGSSSSSQGS